MKLISVILVTLALSLPTQAGCGAILAALPAVVSAAELAGQVLSVIEDYLRAHDVHDAAIDQALLRTRSALVAVLNAAKTAQDLHDKNVVAALDDFASAYDALMQLLAPHGVTVSADGLRLSNAGPHELEVPSAVALRRELQGGQQ